MTSPFSSPRPQYPQAPRNFQNPQPPNGSRSRMVLLLAGLIVVVVVAAVIVAALLFTRSSRTMSQLLESFVFATPLAQRLRAHM